METKERKKKIQVNIDRNLANNVEAVLDSLGLNQTTMITALYKRVEAQGEVPFSLALTKEEKINLELMNASESEKAGQLTLRDKQALTRFIKNYYKYD